MPVNMAARMELNRDGYFVQSVRRLRVTMSNHTLFSFMRFSGTVLGVIDLAVTSAV